MPKPSPEKEAYWRGMLRRQQRSGLSVRQFCSDGGLSEASFFSWKREIAKRDRKAATTADGRCSQAKPIPSQAKPTDSQAKPAAEDAGTASPFIPLRLTRNTANAAELARAAATVIELRHPRGHVLWIPSGFDGTSLEKVLGLLDRERGC